MHRSPLFICQPADKSGWTHLSGIQSVSPSTSPEVTFLRDSEGQWLHITSKIWLLFLTVSSQAFCACISAQEREKTMEEKRLLRPCETSGPCTKNKLAFALITCTKSETTFPGCSICVTFFQLTQKPARTLLPRAPSGKPFQSFTL